MLERTGVFGEERLYLDAFDYLKRIRVEELAEIAVSLAGGFLNIEQTVIETCCGVDCVTGRNPVESAFDLAHAAGETGASLGIVGAVDFFDVAVGILLHAVDFS